MLAKKYKFTTDDFKLIKSFKPKKVFTNIGVFCIYNSLSPNQSNPKFAIAPSKKVFKTAVSRNKHKRYFYNSLQEIIRLNQNYPDFEISQKSIVFYPNKIFTKDEIKTELEKIML